MHQVSGREGQGHRVPQVERATLRLLYGERVLLGTLRSPQAGYALLLLVQAIKVYYERNLDTTGIFLCMFTVGALDVCVVTLYPSKAADLTSVMRICFVVAMR